MQFQVPQNIDLEDPPSPRLRRDETSFLKA